MLQLSEEKGRQIRTVCSRLPIVPCTVTPICLPIWLRLHWLFHAYQFKIMIRHLQKNWKFRYFANLSVPKHLWLALAVVVVVKICILFSCFVTGWNSHTWFSNQMYFEKRISSNTSLTARAGPEMFSYRQNGTNYKRVSCYEIFRILYSIVESVDTKALKSPTRSWIFSNLSAFDASLLKN